MLAVTRERGQGYRRSAAGRRERTGSPVSHESLRAAAWLVILAGLVGLVAGVGASELFMIRDVYVVSPDEELQAEAAERAAELRFGTVWLPPTRTIERCIGGLPRAKQVTIARELPSTLVISVQPRQPIAMVVREGRYMTIDGEGVCLRWVTKKATDLPVVHIEDPNLVRPGSRLRERDMAWVRDVMRGLREYDLLAGASIDLSRPARISVFTADGVLGKLGNERMLYEKTVLFGELLAQLSAKDVTPLYIDLRVPSRPTYKPVG